MLPLFLRQLSSQKVEFIATVFGRAMRRSKFTLGPKPADSISASPKKRIPKFESPKIRGTQEPPKDADDHEEQEEEEISEEDIKRSGLPRAQLELEYTAVLQEREMLLNQLAGLLEEMMVAIPGE